MKESRLPFIRHFLKLREKPKWILKFILVIFIAICSALISTFAIDYDKMFEGLGISSEQQNQQIQIAKISSVIFGAIGSVVNIGITFLIVLIILKIMKSDTNAKSIFSGVLSYRLITGTIGVVVIAIQAITGLSLNDYIITSLNIFDKGNDVLGVFDLKVLINAYIFGVLLYATGSLSKKSAFIWSLLYIVVVIALALLGLNFK